MISDRMTPEFKLNPDDFILRDQFDEELDQPIGLRKGSSNFSSKKKLRGLELSDL